MGVEGKPNLPGLVPGHGFMSNFESKSMPQTPKHKHSAMPGVGTARPPHGKNRDQQDLLDLVLDDQFMSNFDRMIWDSPNSNTQTSSDVRSWELC